MRKLLKPILGAALVGLLSLSASADHRHSRFCRHGNNGYGRVPPGHYWCAQHAEYCNHPQSNYNYYQSYNPYYYNNGYYKPNPYYNNGYYNYNYNYNPYADAGAQVLNGLLWNAFRR